MTFKEFLTEYIDVIFDDGKIERYDYIKKFSDKYGYNYGSIKSIYKNGTHSKKYGIKILNAYIQPV